MWLNLNACVLREFSDIFLFRLSIPLLISGSYLPATFSEVFTEFLHLQNNLSYLCSGLRIFLRSSGNFTQHSLNGSPSVSSLLASFLLKHLFLECSIVSLQTSYFCVLLLLRKSVENCTQFASEFVTLLNENHLVSRCMVSIHF